MMMYPLRTKYYTDPKAADYRFLVELEKQLIEQGYREAERQLEEAKRAVELGRKNLAAGARADRVARRPYRRSYRA